MLIEKKLMNLHRDMQLSEPLQKLSVALELMKGIVYVYVYTYTCCRCIFVFCSVQLQIEHVVKYSVLIY